MSSERMQSRGLRRYRQLVQRSGKTKSLPPSPIAVTMRPRASRVAGAARSGAKPRTVWAQSSSASRSSRPRAAVRGLTPSAATSIGETGTGRRLSAGKFKVIRRSGSRRAHRTPAPARRLRNRSVDARTVCCPGGTDASWMSPPPMPILQAGAARRPRILGPILRIGAIRGG